MELALWLLGGFSAVCVALFAYLRYLQGKIIKGEIAAHDNEAKDKVLDDIKEANRIASEVDRMPDGAAVRELFNKWSNN